MSVLTTKQTGVAGYVRSYVSRLRRTLALHCRILTIDMQATIITANGKALTFSESENVDLFWGIRGGGNSHKKYDLNVIPFSRGKVADICPYDFPFLCNPGAASPARGQSGRVQYRNDPTKVGRTALLASAGEAYAHGP